MKNLYSVLPVQPESSPQDNRQYQLIELANGLKALLVHIPDAQQAAASVAVNAGHFQDPEDTPGLTHFLEHMLFLGSEAYPQPASYSDFISFAGGHHNAWTGTEHSNYYLELPLPHFEEGLKRFSSLLSSPLFDQQWVDKERQAIESEYRLKLKDELRRLYDVHKETSNNEHPFSRFSVGSESTLVDSSNISLLEKLKQVFACYYHAGNMALTLVGPQPIEVLAELAAEHFVSLAPAKEKTTPPKVPLYTKDQLGTWIHIKPLKQANRVLITFAFPEINSDYLHKTTSFIAHLFGYEGPNSLFSMLRNKGWVTSLSAGGGASGSNFKDFTINIQLTDTGRDCLTKVIRACFRYVQLVRDKGLVESLYAERRQMVELAYLFPETMRPVDLASQLSVNLLHYQPQHVISGDFRMDALNKPFAQMLLAHMTPSNSRITVIHPDVKTNKVSRWYNAHYSIQAFSDADIAAFTAPFPQDPKNQHEQLPFAIPSKNPFIPKRTSPHPLTLSQSGTQAVPTKSVISPALDLWHLQDPDFRVPKGHIYLMLRMPFVNSSARNYACSQIWCELGLELLNEAFYDGEVAGMHFNLYPQQGGITLHIAGFSCRQERLFTALVSKLSDFVPSPTMFSEVHQELYNNWSEVHKNSPVNHLFAMLHHHLQQGSFTAKQMAESIEEVDYEHFINILPGLFRDAQATMLVHGDIPLAEARNMAHHAACTLPITTDPETQVTRYVRRLSPGVKQSGFPSSHPDHATAFFLQGENTSDEEKAVFLLFNHLANPLFFSELRTRQQLGYLVGSSYVPMYGLPGILFYIQSPSYSPDLLADHIQAFLATFLEQLQHLDDEHWRGAQQAVSHHLRASASSLRIRAQRLWQSITHNKSDFELAFKLADTVSSLPFEVFQQRMHHHLRDNMAAMALYTTSGKV